MARRAIQAIFLVLLFIPFVAIATLKFRGSFQIDYFAISGGGSNASPVPPSWSEIAFGRGGICYAEQVNRSPNQSRWPNDQAVAIEMLDRKGGSDATKGGINFVSGSQRTGEQRYWITPYNHFLVYTLVPPAIYLTVRLGIARALRFKRDRRITRGQCGFCSYDLRESPERCPECGHVPLASGSEEVI